MKKLTKKYVNELTYKIIGACIEVHKVVGPGLYEDVYHKCLEREFDLLGIQYKSELEIPLIYKDLNINCKVKCNFLVEHAIIVEIKSVEELHKIHKAQTMNYMNLLKVPKSILINFNVYNLYSEGTETFVSKDFEKLS
ncbi:GxxExxY protein [Chryseobacterium profundimaris]|uniref:GxxExxY protein n=1 Tax=Chryseobacterium profundimaris TaxID=1387275 RepID=A0ABY1P869_9FLAO|nr:GxxExxY protein [Chryseobacterium profundimaris]SMP28710.1 GxxExxY protein [Chryseobacterium profundimaris]